MPKLKVSFSSSPESSKFEVLFVDAPSFFSKISGFLSLPESGMAMSYVEKLHIGLRGVNRKFGLRVLNYRSPA